MTAKALARLILSRISGIDDSDLTKAEKQIKEICNKVLDKQTKKR